MLAALLDLRPGGVDVQQPAIVRLQRLFGVLEDAGHAANRKPEQVDLRLGAARDRVREDALVDPHQSRVVARQQVGEIAPGRQPRQLAALVRADVHLDVQQRRSRAGAAVREVKLRAEAAVGHLFELLVVLRLETLHLVESRVKLLERLAHVAAPDLVERPAQNLLGQPLQLLVGQVLQLSRRGDASQLRERTVERERRLEGRHHVANLLLRPVLDEALDLLHQRRELGKCRIVHEDVVKPRTRQPRDQRPGLVVGDVLEAVARTSPSPARSASS